MPNKRNKIVGLPSRSKRLNPGRTNSSQFQFPMAESLEPRRLLSLAITPMEYSVPGPAFDSQLVNGMGPIPPDPSSALGLTSVVSLTVNHMIVWNLKGSTANSPEQLSTFYGPLAGTGADPILTNSLTNLTDSRVVYDQYNGHFVVTTLEVQDDATTHTDSSHILMAVSNNNDPTGVWFYSRFDTGAGGTGLTNYFADQPTINVGTDALFIAANMFAYADKSVSPLDGTRLWVLPKTSFYTNTNTNLPTQTAWNPSAGRDG